MPRLPTFSDEQGVRWARLPAAVFARLCPHHTTWELRGEAFTLPRSSPRTILRILRRRLSPPSAAEALYLRGDPFHLNELYDITEEVRTCVAREEDAALQTAARLAGRRLVQVTRESSPHPTWWTTDLAEPLSTIAGDARVAGVLLDTDWVPDLDPAHLTYPLPHAEEEDYLAQAGWLFEMGEPSVRARGAMWQAVWACAEENLWSCAEAMGDRVRLGVALPLSPGQKWHLSPVALARRGLVPVVVAAGVSRQDAVRGMSLLRLAEAAAAGAWGVASRLHGARRLGAWRALSRGWGFALTGSEPMGDGMEEGRIRPDVVLAHPREERWAYAWDDDSTHLESVSERLAAALFRRGVSWSATDEAQLAAALEKFSPRLVLVAPARSLRAETVRALSKWTDTGGAVAVAEPVPYLADGNANAELERFLTRPRVRRLDIEGARGLRALDVLLRRTRIRPEFGVYGRSNGLAPKGLRRLTLHAGTCRYHTFLHADGEAGRLLLELPGERGLFLWGGGGWQEAAAWHANGNTYLEMDAKPDTTHTLRATPR
jgi:hypothetical protein